MKTVTLEELRDSTEAIVRGAISERTVITDHGQVVAEIKAICPPMAEKRFPPGHWESIPRPKIDVDSTDIVSADRDG